MAYTKTYTNTIPLLPGDDKEQLFWLTRESFQRKAASEGLVLDDDGYTVTDVDPADLHPKAAEPLGYSNSDLEWFKFVGVAHAP